MKDLLRETSVLLADLVCTDLGGLKEKRLPTKMFPPMSKSSDLLYTSAVFRKVPEDVEELPCEWINKESLLKLSDEIEELKSELEKQQIAYHVEFKTCKDQEMKKKITADYFKSRQAAKDMIDRKQKEYTRLSEQTRINFRFRIV